MVLSNSMCLEFRPILGEIFLNFSTLFKRILTEKYDKVSCNDTYHYHTSSKDSSNFPL